MKVVKLFLLLLITSSISVYSQGGPDPCPCDPTDPDFASCLALYPECDENIPVTNELYLIISAGIVYAGYLKFRSKKSFV